MDDKTWWEQRAKELQEKAPGFTAFVECGDPYGILTWQDLIVPYIIKLEKELAQAKRIIDMLAMLPPGTTK